MPNPYLQSSADQISRNLTQNLNENIMPGINSGAIAAGGYGGSRHGIAQGLGIGRTQQAIGDAQTNLYSGAYESDANRSQQLTMQNNQLAQQQRQFDAADATNRFGMTNSYNLGLGGLGLQDKSLDQNFYTANRGLDLSQLGLGANLMNQGNLGLSSQGGQLYQNGAQQQAAPWMQLGNFSNTVGQFSGLNGSSSTSTPGPSVIGSALGGGLTAAQLWQLLSGAKTPGG